MSINPEHLATRIAQFRDERRALQEMVVACFPRGSEVRVKETQEAGIVGDPAFKDPTRLIVKFGGNSVFSMVVDVLNLEAVND